VEDSSHDFDFDLSQGNWYDVWS